MGNNQYFFLTFKNCKNSNKKLTILKLVFHTTVISIFVNPVSYFIFLLGDKDAAAKNDNTPKNTEKPGRTD